MPRDTGRTLSKPREALGACFWRHDEDVDALTANIARLPPSNYAANKTADGVNQTVPQRHVILFPPAEDLDQRHRWRKDGAVGGRLTLVSIFKI